LEIFSILFTTFSTILLDLIQNDITTDYESNLIEVLIVLAKNTAVSPQLKSPRGFLKSNIRSHLRISERWK